MFYTQTSQFKNICHAQDACMFIEMKNNNLPVGLDPKHKQMKNSVVFFSDW